MKLRGRPPQAGAEVLVDLQVTGTAVRLRFPPHFFAKTVPCAAAGLAAWGPAGDCNGVRTRPSDGVCTRLLLFFALR